MRLRNGVITLIFVNIAVFIAQIALGSWFTGMFVLQSADVLARPYILLTSMFLHANPNHLFFNMYALYMFGTLVEARIRTRRFLLAYFLSGILAAVLSAFFYDRALGASGAIMGIIGVTIMLFPDMPVLLFFFIPMSMRTAGIIFAAIDILGVFLPNNVANIAHLVGLGTGLAFGYYLKEKGLKRRGRGRKKIISEYSVMMSDSDIDDYFKYGRV